MILQIKAKFYMKSKKLEIRKNLGDNVSEHDNVKREQIYSFI